MKRKLFGTTLLESGALTDLQLDEALNAQKELGLRLGDTAFELGFINKNELLSSLAAHFNIPFVRLDDDAVFDVSIVGLIPEDIARRYHIIAFERKADILTVAMSDPTDIVAVDKIRAITRLTVKKALSTKTDILNAIDKYYKQSATLERDIKTIVDKETNTSGISMNEVSMSEDPLNAEQLKVEADDAPVVKFVNLLLMHAVRDGSSDIHLEPKEDKVFVRMRVDGLLRELTPPSKSMYSGILTRIKIMGNLNIAERRLPQDGRFKFTVFDKTIDIRLSTLPTVFGEKIVMRILDRGNLILDMEQLGFSPDMLADFKKTLKMPHGVILNTGPTGSGKTTTLYAALQYLVAPEINIVTIEDPVEYQLEDINQVNTKPQIGFNFADGLRSILRQDPDIIMVGEIRDIETAEIAVRSALTGHLVLSTLHTNDSVSAVTRLIDMGIEPFLISATLNLSIAQRLVRRLCPDCRQEYTPNQDLLNLFFPNQKNIKNIKFYRAAGCKNCFNTGYKGRIALYEMFFVNDAIRAKIAAGDSEAGIRKLALKNGFQSIVQSGIQKVKEGVTTLEELSRVSFVPGDI